MKKKKKIDGFNIVLHLFFILFCACFIIPLVLVISASFTSEGALALGGFSLLPREFTLEAYRSAFANGERMIRAYIVTIAQAGLGTFLACVICGMMAYPLSRTNFRFKGFLTGFIFITMLFSAGMIPRYIVFAKYYGINDSFLIYILPVITGGAWNTLIFRTFFKGLPESLFESAHMDGAKELTVFFKIVVPLSTPVFASIAFMTLVTRWNDYSTSMIYIRDEKLYTLQFLLQRIMKEADFLKNLANSGELAGIVNIENMLLPSENLKYAMCIIAAGPMLVIFPFFQKYFSQGLTVGAVKG
ncbi:MAG: carbohydrate ABC transporter permease [Lachnospiraceae bacterium]|nr:carbohydrate ABC transporter permease [Lachnospiraceae bacterium]